MQIVIDIDEWKYKSICEGVEASKRCGVATMNPYIDEAIYKGTPLPEGHGRLIIEPTKEEIEKTVGGQNDFAECIRDSVKAVLDNAETIIEADTEESEVEDGNRKIHN